MGRCGLAAFDLHKALCTDRLVTTPGVVYIGRVILMKETRHARQVHDIKRRALKSHMYIKLTRKQIGHSTAPRYSFASVNLWGSFPAAFADFPVSGRCRCMWLLVGGGCS